jgi:hypothetical protein
MLWLVHKLFYYFSNIIQVTNNTPVIFIIKLMDRLAPPLKKVFTIVYFHYEIDK